jgi:hypothetical protein
LYGNGFEYHELGTGFFIHKGMMRAEFVDDGMSYIIQRDHWYDIIYLSMCSPAHDKTVDTKHSFCEEVECVFDQLPKYQMKNFVTFQCLCR